MIKNRNGFNHIFIKIMFTDNNICSSYLEESFASGSKSSWFVDHQSSRGCPLCRSGVVVVTATTSGGNGGGGDGGGLTSLLVLQLLLQRLR